LREKIWIGHLIIRYSQWTMKYFFIINHAVIVHHHLFILMNQFFR
jgi:hypothetical protein